VKRPSCKWKGQTDADEALPEARVARLAECRIEQKAGYNQHASFSQSPPTQHIINYMLHLKKKGLSESTIKTKSKILRVMERNNVDLNDVEAVKLFIATRDEWSNGHKQIAVYAYDHYAKMKGIEWKPAFYKYDPFIPFVPTEKEVDSL
jgi:hypothetical protein